MNIPGFTAESSLLISNAGYRASSSNSGGFPSGDLVALAGGFLGPVGSGEMSWYHPAPAWLGEMGSGTAWSTCDAVGKPCCGPDAEVKTQHCHKSLGCNTATGACESCGGPGQVCCDGHFTGFSGKGYTGVLLDPTERIQSCNPGNRCDAELGPDGVTWAGTRRCQPCGTKLGGACCAADGNYGLGHCFQDSATGVRLVCKDPWAKSGSGVACVACGRPGQPVCMTAGERACDPGLTEENGLCVHCGRPGELPCDWTGCDKQDAVLDQHTGRCVDAGKWLQPCKWDSTCSEASLICNAKKKCEGCGFSRMRSVNWEPCCPPSTGGPECWEGKCTLQPDGKSRCVCGVPGYPSCLCGNEFGKPCGDNQCVGDLANYNGVCLKPGSSQSGSPPPPPPAPSGWKTCDGENWSLATLKRPVYLQNPATKCLEFVEYNSNSVTEAYKCASRDHGSAVVTDPVGQYQFAFTNAFGCNSKWIDGTSEDEAQECAQWQCTNCTVTPGPCF